MLLQFVYAALLLLPLSFFIGVGARRFHSMPSCSKLLDVVAHSDSIVILIARCCFGALCVRDGLAASTCVCLTSAASLEPLPWGWRAVAFPPWLHDDDVHRCLSTCWLIMFVVASAACVLASLALKSAELRPLVVIALFMLPSQALLLLTYHSRYSRE